MSMHFPAKRNLLFLHVWQTLPCSLHSSQSVSTHGRGVGDGVGGDDGEVDGLLVLGDIDGVVEGVEVGANDKQSRPNNDVRCSGAVPSGHVSKHVPS